MIDGISLHGRVIALMIDDITLHGRVIALLTYGISLHLRAVRGAENEGQYDEPYSHFHDMFHRDPPAYRKIHTDIVIIPKYYSKIRNIHVKKIIN